MCGHGGQAEHEPAMLSTAHTYLGCWGQFWAPQYRRATDILEQVQRRATKTMMRLQHPPHEKRRKAGPAQPGTGKLLEVCASYLILRMCISTQWGVGGHSSTASRARLFSVVPKHHTTRGQEETGTDWNIYISRWEKAPMLLAWCTTSKVCPENLWSLHSWRCSKPHETESHAICSTKLCFKQGSESKSSPEASPNHSNSAWLWRFQYFTKKTQLASQYRINKCV